jgi:hypothetical protein
VELVKKKRQKFILQTYPKKQSEWAPMHRKKLKNLWTYIIPTACDICGVKPEHSRLIPYGKSWRISHVIQIFSVIWKPHCL